MLARFSSVRLPSLGRFIMAALALTLWQAAPRAEAAVTAGGLAILGFTDHSDLTSDTFSVAALEQITAGTVVYFTDNGWDTFGSGSFRGASALDGDGNETLIKLTILSNITAGTIMRAGFDTADFQWDTSSLIPGTSDAYDFLALVHSGGGEQIYAFEAGVDPPLFNPSNHIFLLDTGDFNSPGFEDAIDNNTGNVAPGLSTLANTAVELPDGSFGDDPTDFHNGTFALNMAHPTVAALNTLGGTKAQWLALIADSQYWTGVNYEIDPFSNGGEGQLTSLNVTPVPEPGRVALLMLGLGTTLLRRHRPL